MNENYEARTLILATGAVHKKLGIPGEKELTGAGFLCKKYYHQYGGKPQKTGRSG